MIISRVGKTGFVFCVLMLLWMSFPSAGSTVLVLSNGDRLKGAGVRREKDLIHFTSEVLGEMTLKASQVKEIIPPADPPKRPAPVSKPAPPAAAKPAPKPAVAKAVQPKPKKRWSGNLGFSLNQQHAEYQQRSGTSLRRYEKDTEYLRLSGRAKWDRDRHHFEWKGSYVYSLVNESKNTDVYDCTQRYRCDVTDRWFGQAETSYERNYLRVLAREIQQSSGIGWYPVKTPKLTLDLVPGVNYYYRDQADEISEGVIPSLSQNLTSRLSKDLSLFQGFTYTGCDDQYYYKFNVGFNNKLVRNLSLRMEYRYEVDANVDEDTDPFVQRQLLSSFQYSF
jgi:hypothetical protein